MPCALDSRLRGNDKRWAGITKGGTNIERERKCQRREWEQQRKDRSDRRDAGRRQSKNPLVSFSQQTPYVRRESQKNKKGTAPRKDVTSVLLLLHDFFFLYHWIIRVAHGQTQPYPFVQSSPPDGSHRHRESFLPEFPSSTDVR